MKEKDYLLIIKTSAQIASNLCDQLVAPNFRRRFNNLRRRRRSLNVHMF